MQKHQSLLDRIFIAADNGLRTLFADSASQRPNPSAQRSEEDLSPEERRHSAALMRINHTGEVCAQALYYGQAIASRSKQTQEMLLTSAQEETDHLAWCEERLNELQDRTSYLNPLWYVGSLGLGLVSGLVSDAWSLGFVAATEEQVATHLENHLERISPRDLKSRMIIEQMHADESDHRTAALKAGAFELPQGIKRLMQAMSKAMTSITYYV